MPTREEALVELYKRGKLNDRQKSVVEEMGKRGLLQLPVDDKPGVLDYLMHAGESALAIGTAAVAEPLAGMGGIAKTITSGPDEGAKTIEQIREGLTYKPRGEMTKDAMGNVFGKLGEVVSPVVEGYRERVADPLAEKGGPLAGTAAMTLPVAILEILGLKGTRAAKKAAIKKAAQNIDASSAYDEAGRLIPELKQQIEASGIKIDEIRDVLPESIPSGRTTAAEQSRTKDLFDSEGVPLSRGELNKNFKQQATEQRLLESSQDTAAEPFRQFKLKQSETIKGNLESVLGPEVTASETGELIQGALQGRKKLLRTQKNDLYRKADELTGNKESIPLFTDNISEVIPDARTIKRLDRASKGAVSDVMDTLAEYGIVEPTERMLKEGVEPEVLSISNFEDLRQTLNFIEKGDQSKAVSVVTGKIKRALDREIDELAENIDTSVLSKDAIETLKEARSTTRQLKSEFSPKGFVDRLTQQKGDSLDMVVEASKVYDKLAARSTPVEQVNRTINSLKKAPDGEQALASLQTSIIMDLVDAGFGTESRQISGIRTFSPIAYKRRLKAIGEDKLAKIFENNKESFRKIRNVDKIASELVPPSGAVPKGSASVILDSLNSLGLASISTKVPGGAVLMGALKKIGEPIKTGVDVRKAMKADPEVMKTITLLDRTFPGLAYSLGISNLTEGEENE